MRPMNTTRLIGLKRGRCEPRPCDGKCGFLTYTIIKAHSRNVYNTNGGYDNWFNIWSREQIWGKDYFDAENRRKNNSLNCTEPPTKE